MQLKRVTKIFIFIILTILSFSFTNYTKVNAISNEAGSDPSGKSQRYVIENAPWYDPTACPGYTATSNNPSLQGKVYLIGDSITANTQFVQNDLINRLKARGFSDVVINSLSSRSLSSGSSELNGISVFEKDTSWLNANTIIIELGTNGGVTRENISKIMTLVKSNNPTANVFWVNVGVNNSQRPNNPIDTAKIDKTLKDNTDLGYKVIDWRSVVEQHPEYISDLGVHPFTKEGGAAFVDTVINGLSNLTKNSNSIGGSCQCLASIGEGSLNLVGKENEEKVWNYLISAGFTPAQAAGIIGNMWAESGVNPRRVQGTKTPEGDRDYPPVGSGIGYGLVQWTPGTKILPYAESKNKIPGDLGFQLELLVAQLKGDPSTGLAEKNAGDDLIRQTSPEDAAKSFMLKFERPLDQGVDAQNRRAEKAREVFERFGGISTGGFTSSSGCNSASSTDGSSAKIVEVAQRELLLGANEADDSYRKYTENGIASPNGWCDFFVSWVLNEAGAPFTGGRGKDAPGHIITPVTSIAAYFKNKNTFYPAGGEFIPKPGDIVIFDYDKDDKLDHVSIVISLDGEKLTTIGGNESDKVSKNTYASYKDKDIYGFGRQ